MKPPTRRPAFGSAKEAAEAAFKTATSKAPEPASAKIALPNLRETVSLRIDQDVLEHFRAAGAGWQDRINEALRKAVGN